MSSNGDTCQGCGWWKRICKCNGNTKGFHTTKDKLFEFTEEFGNERYDINSKGQWKKFMKQHGLTDDKSQSRRNYRTRTDWRKNTLGNTSIREAADGAVRDLKSRGLWVSR